MNGKKEKKKKTRIRRNLNRQQNTLFTFVTYIQYKSLTSDTILNLPANNEIEFSTTISDHYCMCNVLTI